MIRLHIGAGDKFIPNAINCDRHGQQDVNCDAFPLPFSTDYADELWAIHLFEHLHRSKASECLTEWFRVLKPGGILVMELPCLDKIAHMLVNGETNIRLTLLGLFGDPRDARPDMDHKWCWGKKELMEALSSVGYEQIVFMEPIFHIAKRDMRVECKKPGGIA
jgi:ubiquinone/menaquinone biosynthesis C-methylase UbiE